MAEYIKTKDGVTARLDFSRSAATGQSLLEIKVDDGKSEVHYRFDGSGKLVDSYSPSTGYAPATRWAMDEARRKLDAAGLFEEPPASEKFKHGKILGSLDAVVRAYGVKWGQKSQSRTASGTITAPSPQAQPPAYVGPPPPLPGYPKPLSQVTSAERRDAIHRILAGKY